MLEYDGHHLPGKGNRLVLHDLLLTVVAARYPGQDLPRGLLGCISVYVKGHRKAIREPLLKGSVHDFMDSGPAVLRIPCRFLHHLQKTCIGSLSRPQRCKSASSIRQIHVHLMQISGTRNSKTPGQTWSDPRSGTVRTRAKTTRSAIQPCRTLSVKLAGQWNPGNTGRMPQWLLCHTLSFRHHYSRRLCCLSNRPRTESSNDT